MVGNRMLEQQQSGAHQRCSVGSKLTRRSAVKLGLAAVAVAGSDALSRLASAAERQETGRTLKAMNSKVHVVVVGAGAFGGWTALYLLRGGAQVTLLDAWGPGNSRASSGGETRVIRGAYGPNQPYTRMSARAMEIWEEHEAQWKQRFFHSIGVLWMVEGDGEFERESLPMLKDAGIPFEQLSAKELAQRWKQISLEKVEWGIWEPQSGYLLARASTQAVVEHFVAEGGEYRQTAVTGQGLEDWDGKGLPLSDGAELSADRYVFACGPWLGKLFPQTVGPHFLVTKQDVFFFGTPAGDDRYNEGNMPVWADHSDRFMYGIPGNEGRGFKLADDTRGAAFDPTSEQRLVSDDRLAEARRYLAYRFPGMKNAPLLETRVCQYENTTDHNFIIDRHPANPHVWIVGGGSGHGFKHGPALGEMVARSVLKDESAEPLYRLARFDGKKSAP
jgi:sarcosine oxidase